MSCKYFSKVGENNYKLSHYQANNLYQVLAKPRNLYIYNLLYTIMCEWINQLCRKYSSRLVIIFACIIITRYAFFKSQDTYYDYISYLFSIGLLILLLLPNLDQFNFLGINAHGVHDDTDKIKAKISYNLEGGSDERN